MKTLPGKNLIINFSIVIYLLLFSTLACSTSDPIPAPQKFWNEFRQAVIAKNNKKLINATHFPLEVRGVDDSQASVFYEKAQFEAIFTKILKQPVLIMDGDKIIMKTTRDNIVSTNTITTEHMLTSHSYRVDQLVFEFKNKQWKLILAYLEE